MGLTGDAENRLRRLDALLERWIREDRLGAAAYTVGDSSRLLPSKRFGNHGFGAVARPMRGDDRFLVASLTKPIVACAVMMLVERGVMALDDRVVDYAPGFGKDEVSIRHLLTHTSGLPDMVPENDALRAAHAPLSAFLDRIHQLPLAFPPGTAVRYQSTGFAMLAEVIHQVTGESLPTFLLRELFLPLGMSASTLGLVGEPRDQAKPRVVPVRLPQGTQANDWNWNSDYWLGFGAPWGGLISTPEDLGRLLRLIVRGGELDGVRVLSPATIRVMMSNQLASMPGIPEVDRRCRPWGLGWRLNWPGHTANFGDLLGPRSSGHWGATGTLFWVDPDLDLVFVLLTNQPQGEDGRFLARASNVAIASLS